MKKLVIAALLLVATTYALAATTKEDATERLKNAGDVLHEIMNASEKGCVVRMARTCEAGAISSLVFGPRLPIIDPSLPSRTACAPYSKVFYPDPSCLQQTGTKLQRRRPRQRSRQTVLRASCERYSLRASVDCSESCCSQGLPLYERCETCTSRKNQLAKITCCETRRSPP